MNFLLLFLSCFYLLFGSSHANITTTQFLRDPEELVSRESFFKFGFFSPDNSTNRYVGIWYNKNASDILEIIWIANRDNPLNDSSGVLNISEDGNLQLLNGENITFWSTNIEASYEVNNSVAQLLDTGNLVLLSNASGSIIWQSFDHPTHSLLPRMEVTIDTNTNTSEPLKSWKSASDPSTGNFSAGLDPRTLSEIFVWDGDRPCWRSGPWNGHVFIGVPSMYYFALVDGFHLHDNHEGVLSLSFSTSSQRVTEHYVLSPDGVIIQKDWDDDRGNWTVIWQSLESECDIYGRCGEFGICNSNNSPICRCLKGFKPRNNQEWSEGNWSNGCLRSTPLQCASAKGEEDGFLMLRNTKVPDNAEWLFSEDEGHCRRQCLGNCSCIAYAYYLGIGCMVWTRSLIDTQDFSSIGVDLYVRLAHSELEEIGSRWRLIMAITMVSGGVIFVAAMFCIWRQIRRKNGEKNAIRNDTQLHSIKLESDSSDVKLQDLPLYQFDQLAAATNNFDDRNKLGQGGFGPVFKGEFEDGQEIAVKRLSRASGQGLQEFMNEMDVISKLQHRNLVKLLGCCVDGEENMLVYEYMPNKSLDAFLFGSQNQELLDWKKRLNIIKGICRGLLYLHRDSRLRIIHRDLKPSNILLDEELNAKISDFGMARIFGVKEDQGSTNRIVGTYGYMSPEYAMEGRFSEKSDVFSFGVLLLEIVSGRKNTSFIDDESWSLIGYAWKLRNEDNIHSLIDPRIKDPCLKEILRCIEVGLLCVQEFPEERPSISTIISMLDSEITDLPQPVQPVFTQNKHYYPKRCPQICDQVNVSVNDLTFTSHVSGR